MQEAKDAEILKLIRHGSEPLVQHFDIAAQGDERQGERNNFV